jgi:hypothetical protein
MKKILFNLFTPNRAVFNVEGPGQQEAAESKTTAPESSEVSDKAVDDAKAKADKAMDLFTHKLNKGMDTSIPELQPIKDVAEEYKGKLDNLLMTYLGGLNDYGSLLKEINKLSAEYDEALIPASQEVAEAMQKRREKLKETRRRLAEKKEKSPKDVEEAEKLADEAAQLQESLATMPDWAKDGLDKARTFLAGLQQDYKEVEEAAVEIAAEAEEKAEKGEDVGPSQKQMVDISARAEALAAASMPSFPEPPSLPDLDDLDDSDSLDPNDPTSVAYQAPIDEPAGEILDDSPEAMAKYEAEEAARTAKFDAARKKMDEDLARHKAEYAAKKAKEAADAKYWAEYYDTSNESATDRMKRRASMFLDRTETRVAQAGRAVVDTGEAVVDTVADAHEAVVDRTVETIEGVEAGGKAVAKGVSDTHEAAVDMGVAMIEGTVETGEAVGEFVQDTGEVAVGLALLAYDEVADTIRPGVKWVGEQVDNGLTWTGEKWDGFVSGAEFAANYVKDGVIDTAKCVADMGQEAFDAMVDGADYIVKVGDKYYNIATDAGAEAIAAVVDTAEAAGETLVDAGEIAAGLALLAWDEVTDTVKKGAKWTEKQMTDAADWTGEQWDKLATNVGFAANYVKDGVIDTAKCVADMGQEAFDAMVDGADHIVKVGDKYYNIATDAGAEAIAAVVETAEAAGETLVDAGEIAAGLALLAWDEVTDTVGRGAAWTEKQISDAADWTGEQWDKLATTGEFCYQYCKDGIVDTGKAIATMGVDAYEAMVSKADHLVEYAGNVINIATDAGAELIAAVADTAEAVGETLVDTGEIAAGLALLAWDEVADTVKKGAKWTEKQMTDAADWTGEQWDGLVSSIEFAGNYVKDGVIDTAKCVADMGQEAFDAMVDGADHIVKVGDKYYNIATDAGAEAIAAVADTAEAVGETLVDAGEVAAGLALLAFDEVADTVGRGAKWTEKQMTDAADWTGEKWDKLATTAEFAANYVKDGVIDTAKCIADMGQEAFDAMVDGADHIVKVGDKYYNVATDAGAEALAVVGETLADASDIATGFPSYVYDEIDDAVKKGAKWTGKQIDAAKNFTSNQWDGLVSSTEFATNYVVDGVVDTAKCIADFGEDAYNAMVENTTLLVDNGGKLIKKAESRGEEAFDG